MAWKREGKPTKSVRVILQVSPEKNPELAAFIWSLPYGKASSTLRDILSDAVKRARAPRPPKASAAAPGPAVTHTDVSTEAADSIRKLADAF